MGSILLTRLINRNLTSRPDGPGPVTIKGIQLRSGWAGHGGRQTAGLPPELADLPLADLILNAGLTTGVLTVADQQSL